MDLVLRYDSQNNNNNNTIAHIIEEKNTHQQHVESHHFFVAIAKVIDTAMHLFAIFYKLPQYSFE